MSKINKDLRIYEFRGENFKRLKVVQIQPESNAVIIAGDNEQGKTAIFDGIEAGLGGKDALKDTPEPIHRGETKGSVYLDLGEFIVTRTFTKTDSYLKVTSPEGAAYPNPQSLLNGFYNKHTIDPSVFISLDEEKQFKLLKEIVQMDIDVDELERLRKKSFDERTIVNREVKSLEARLTAKPKPGTGLPEKEISASEIIDKITEVNDTITANNEMRAELRQMGVTYKQKKEARNSVETEIHELQQQLKEMDDDLAKLQKEGKDLQTKVEALEDPDVDPLNEDLRNVESINKKIREAKEYFDLDETLTKKKQEAEILSKEIGDYETQKQEALEKATFPIEGLGFSENGITFKGLPFTQASQEEKIRVALSIAIAQNPKLKVILIRNGAFFDKKNLELVKKIAKEKDFQIWIERVEDTTDTGIIIEDGSVKSLPVKKEEEKTTLPKNGKKKTVKDSIFE